MDGPELTHDALYDAVMILAESWVESVKPKMRARWRRNAERRLREPSEHPEAREQSAVWIRGLFEMGMRPRS